MSIQATMRVLEAADWAGKIDNQSATFTPSQLADITEHIASREVRALQLINELENVKAEKQLILKFINDSCYVFDGEGDDYSDAYVDAISHSMMPSVDYKGIEGVRKP
jgi:hypothetical protein